MRKLLLLVPVLAFALATAAPALADTIQVHIMSTGFSPAAVSVQNGDRVVWTNDDKAARQVVADDGTFKSPLIAPGDQWAHVFAKAGAFPYHGGVVTARHGMVNVLQSRAVTISGTRKVVTFNGFVLLSGSVSSGKAGEQVTIRQKPQGSDIFLRVTTVATTDNGLWQVRVRPRRNTVYEAVWNNVASPEQFVLVKPLVKLRQIGSHLFAVGVHAQARLRYRFVLIQRWARARHRWLTVKTVQLTTVRTAGFEANSTGTFRLRVRHGTLIRALLPEEPGGARVLRAGLEPRRPRLGIRSD